MLSNHIRATHTGLRSAYETMFSVFSAVGAQFSLVLLYGIPGGLCME